jgi:hypothetical protein
MADRAYAALLAEQIQTACTEAMLTWGEAINRAEASPKDEGLKRLAQCAGLECARLASGVAARLRPARGRG